MNETRDALRPLTPRTPRDPAVRVVLLLPRDRAPLTPAQEDKRDDAIAWSLSVALRWFEDELDRPGRMNVDLNVVKALTPWDSVDLHRWGDQVGDPLWFRRLFEDRWVGLGDWARSPAVVCLVAGARRFPFTHAFAWGGSSTNLWTRPGIPSVVALGDYHIEAMLSRNATWLPPLLRPLIPSWWPLRTRTWGHAAALLAHELGHALGDFWDHPDDDSIMNPANVDAWPAAGLSAELRERMLSRRDLWL